MSKKIKEELQKQLDANFLKVVNYPTWIANIVQVHKKDVKVKMCVDYRDLNRAIHIDDFPLRHIDMIHKEIEVYVDGMIVKYLTKEDHLVHLQKLFERLRNFRLRLNPNKCTFGVRSGKFLGFMVSGKGIEVDPMKVKAI